MEILRGTIEEIFISRRALLETLQTLAGVERQLIRTRLCSA
jgi:hypothetical protein